MYTSQSDVTRTKSIHSDMPHDAKRRTSNMLTSTFFDLIEDASLRPSNVSLRVPCIVTNVIPPTVSLSKEYLSWRTAVGAGAVGMENHTSFRNECFLKNSITWSPAVPRRVRRCSRRIRARNEHVLVAHA